MPAEIAITENVSVTGDLARVGWLHDAEYEVSTITADPELRTVEVPMAQSTTDLPAHPALPKPVGKRRLGFTRTLVPYVQCRLVARGVIGYSFTEGDDLPWGVVNQLRLAPTDGAVVIEAAVGRDICIHVDRLELTVEVTNRVVYYRRCRAFRSYEVHGGRISPEEVAMLGRTV